MASQYRTVWSPRKVLAWPKETFVEINDRVSSVIYKQTFNNGKVKTKGYHVNDIRC